MWNNILKSTLEDLGIVEPFSWISKDRISDGEAELVDGEYGIYWQINQFGLEKEYRNKGLGEKYLREFIDYLEGEFETNDIPLVHMPVGEAITFWERMEEKGLVIV